MSSTTYFAPAKINLTLEVLGRRDDGYHEVRSVMQAVSLGDCLTFNPSDEMLFECNLPGWSAERSLVSRVVARLQEVGGRKKGARITIAKRIPLASGLGGDASDAAAVLLGLNELWQLHLSLERLIEIAAGLGSDVPFFLRSGTALSSGRDRKSTRLNSSH